MLWLVHTLPQLLAYADTYGKLVFCFWCNLVAWVLSMLDSCILRVYIGLMDLSIAVSLIPAVYWQSIYIPSSRGTCQHAISWQVSNASESWFTVLAKLHNPANPDPEGCCDQYVEKWISSIVVM